MQRPPYGQLPPLPGVPLVDRRPVTTHSHALSGWETLRTLIYLTMGFALIGFAVAGLVLLDNVHANVKTLLEHENIVLAARSDTSSTATPTATLSRLVGTPVGAAARYVLISEAAVPYELLGVTPGEHVLPAVQSADGTFGGCFALNATHETCTALTLQDVRNGTLVGVLVESDTSGGQVTPRPLLLPRRADGALDASVATGGIAPLRAITHGSAAQCVRPGAQRCQRCLVSVACACAFEWTDATAADACMVPWCTASCFRFCEAADCQSFAPTTATTASETAATGETRWVHVVVESFDATEGVASRTWWSERWLSVLGQHPASGSARKSVLG